jgi:hypothetical protein
MGQPSPRLLSVLRPMPNGGHVPLVVDLRRAMKDPNERILIQAGDLLVLQEMPGDAIGRYVYQAFFNFDILWRAVRTSNAAGIVDVAAPDRLTGTRAGTFSFFQTQ